MALMKGYLCHVTFLSEPPVVSGVVNLRCVCFVVNKSNHARTHAQTNTDMHECVCMHAHQHKDPTSI